MSPDPLAFMYLPLNIRYAFYPQAPAVLPTGMTTLQNLPIPSSHRITALTLCNARSIAPSTLPLPRAARRIGAGCTARLPQHTKHRWEPSFAAHAGVVAPHAAAWVESLVCSVAWRPCVYKLLVACTSLGVCDIVHCVGCVCMFLNPPSSFYSLPHGGEG